MSRKNLFLFALAAFLVSAPWRTQATTQMHYSFLIKTNGAWSLSGDYLNGAGLVVFNADTRSNVVLLVRDLIPRNEFDQCNTTAGPKWGEGCLRYLAELDGRTFFRARTQYGTDILIDLEEAKPVSSRNYAAQLERWDKKEIALTLENANRILDSLDSTNTIYCTDRTLHSTNLNCSSDAVAGAILNCASYSLTNCVPYLRKIESIDVPRSGTLPSGSDPYTKQKPIDEKEGYWRYTEYEIRRLVALTLRRLGEVPRGFPPIEFLWEEQTNAVGANLAGKNMSRLQSGDTPTSVYKLLGSPDYIENAWREEPRERIWWGTWRYDIDAPVPCTLLVIWDDDGTVGRVERTTPPLWHGDALISDDSVKPAFRPDGSILRGDQLYGKAFRGRIEVMIPGQ